LFDAPLSAGSEADPSEGDITEAANDEALAVAW
jgi:hypothetical protein